MKQRIERFFRGRYGMDSFNRFIAIVSLVFFLCGMFTEAWLLCWVSCFILGYSYYRMLSRNTSRRAQENLAFHQLKQSALMGFSGFRNHFSTWLSRNRSHAAQRKTHKLFRCPHCRQELRVPRGRGTIEVTCPKCHTTFLNKS